MPIGLAAVAALLIAMRLGAGRFTATTEGAPEEAAAKISVVAAADEGCASNDTGSDPVPAERGPVPDAVRYIAGHVQFSDRTPAAGCLMTLCSSAAPTGQRRSWEVTAGVDGAFRFDGLAAEDYALDASTEPGFTDLRGGISLPQTGQHHDLVVTLMETRHVTVTVVDTTGAPVAGATLLFFTGDRRNTNFPSTTDENGMARESVYGNPDQLSVDVWHEPPGNGHVFLHPQRVKLSPRQDSVRLVLEECGVATGVVSFEGLPMHWSQARVVIVRDGREIARTTADPEGRFVAPVPIQGSVTLKVDFSEVVDAHMDAPGEWVEARVDGVRAGDHDLVLAVRTHPRDRKLRVRAVAPDGTAAARAVIRVRQCETGCWAACYADAAGIAEFDHLPASEVAVRIHSWEVDGAASEWLPADEIRLLPDGQEIVIRLRQGTRLLGTVLRPDGQPCPVARVTASRGGESVIHVDAGGRFSLLIDPDDPTPLDLEAWAGVGHGQLFAKVTGVDPRAGEIVLRLQR